jgi:hypothetical protein
MRHNINPEIWGGCAWDFLLHCAQGADERSYESYKKLVDLLPDVLPCSACREHCDKYIRENPLDDARNDITGWLERFRSQVAQNNALGRRTEDSSIFRMDNNLVVGAAVTALLLLLLVMLVAGLRRK